MNKAVPLALAGGLIVGGIAAGAIGYAQGYDNGSPKRVTVQIDRHPTFQPLVCAFAKDTALVDCQDGIALEYDNHGWWYPTTPRQLRATWNLPPKLK